ncbi:hypothetical protein PPACK8108_LOCUS14034 [Phakopsora pachyrhizi]|uniref:Uncharacterized protein n=1 Tax=Phakopsora pachyrhizi TaxID=170000 RepID=A0AAV0B6J6_PHAPC|nr:hypothetical protein PPACK8108_LOCUS14034 [Phakopsora pachyrhizi]
MPDFKPFFGELIQLTHFLVTNPNLPVLAIDPSNDSIRFSECCQLQTEPTNKLLMRRYATIQRARDSDVFGILIVDFSDKKADEKTFRKKAYMVLVGKLKPENCIEENEDDYLSADEAMSKERRSGRRRRREWEGRLVLDLERLLNTWRSEKSLEEVKKGKSSLNETQDGVEKNAPVYSMVTGSYKY